MLNITGFLAAVCVMFTSGRVGAVDLSMNVDTHTHTHTHCLYTCCFPSNSAIQSLNRNSYSHLDTFYLELAKCLWGGALFGVILHSNVTSDNNMLT